jgi:cytochrome c biogenesis protein CcdA/thiol-disulfide isomerase/thioredoxin
VIPAVPALRQPALACLLAALLALLIPAATLAAADDGAPAEVSLYLFWGQGCPHCEDQLPFIAGLERDYPALTVYRHEVWRDREHRALFHDMARAHGLRPGSVPMLFVGGRAWVGDSPAIRREVEAAVLGCISSGCPDPRHLLAPAGTAPRQPAALRVPLLGELDLALQPLLLSTLLIGLVDGVNPCSLWVLTVLLALVLHSGSRRRVAIVGVTFLTTTALIYGLFIVGVFGMLSYVAWLGWVQVGVALFALLVGAVNIKDYFWFQRGLSLTIAPHHKPAIFARIRGLMDPGHSTLSLMAATALMAAGISLVELPCTAGFPVIWSGLVLEAQPGLLVFAALLGLYLFLYLLIELAVLGVALTTLSMTRLEERHGRNLKLLGGMVMLALGLALLLAPGLMNELAGSLLVFGAALAGTVALMLVRWLLAGQPRPGA